MKRDSRSAGSLRPSWIVSGALPAVRSCHPPRGDSRSSAIESAREASSVPYSLNREATRDALPSGPASCGNAPANSAVKTSPSVSSSAPSVQRASGWCSTTVMRSVSGHSRRSATVFTQGTRCSESRASGSRRVKNVPRSSSRTTAARCAALARRSSPSITTCRSANAGCRTAQAAAPHADSPSAASAKASASTFNWRGLSHMRASEDFDAKIGKADARLFRRHRHQAVAGHPGRSVHLEELPRPVGTKDEIESTPAARAYQPESLQRFRLDRTLHRPFDPARTEVPRFVGEILVVIVVIALRRLDADERQGAIAEDGRGQLGAGNEFLGEHQIVVLLGLAVRDRELVVIDGADLGEADGRTLARGLDDQRQTQLGDHGPPVGPCVDDAVARRRDAACEPHQLRAPLVHRERRTHDAAARVRNAQRLERALDGAVLAEAAVQRDERALEALGLELVEGALGRIERVRVHALALQRSQDRVAGEERDLSLRARSAHQHGDFAEFAQWTPGLAGGWIDLAAALRPERAPAP